MTRSGPRVRLRGRRSGRRVQAKREEALRRYLAGLAEVEVDEPAGES